MYIFSLKLPLANEDAANLLNNPIERLHSLPVLPNAEAQPLLNTHPVLEMQPAMAETPNQANLPIVSDDSERGSMLLTKPKNVHVHVAAPNVEVEVESMKHGLVAKKPVQVSANVSRYLRPYWQNCRLASKRSG